MMTLPCHTCRRQCQSRHSPLPDPLPRHPSPSHPNQNLSLPSLLAAQSQKLERAEATTDATDEAHTIDWVVAMKTQTQMTMAHRLAEFSAAAAGYQMTALVGRQAGEHRSKAWRLEVGNHLVKPQQQEVAVSPLRSAADLAEEGVNTSTLHWKLTRNDCPRVLS